MEIGCAILALHDRLDTLRVEIQGILFDAENSNEIHLNQMLMLLTMHELILSTEQITQHQYRFQAAVVNECHTIVEIIP